MILKVTVSTESAWHVGTGTADPSRTDAETVRVAPGDPRPALPGSSLKGLARDRARLIADATGRGDLIDTVFGTARRSGSWWFASALPIGDRLELSSRPPVSKHNRVDPLSGRVPDNLFFDLEVGGEVELCAVVESVDPEPDSIEVAFLAASLVAIERLGGRRRRGWGRCLVAVEVADGLRRGQQHDRLIASLFGAAP